jgi:hypothetical protein
VNDLYLIYHEERQLYYKRSENRVHEFVKRVHAKHFERRIAEVWCDWLSKQGERVRIVGLSDYKIQRINF